MRIFSLFLLLFCIPLSASTSIKIIFIIPNSLDDPFWNNVAEIARSAAKDLSINLQILSNQSRNIQYRQIKIITEQKVKPDYVIFMPSTSNGSKSFHLLNNANIPFITLEQTLLNENEYQVSIGKPQQYFSYWLGEILYDNAQASKLLALTLLSHQKKHYAKQGDYSLFGLSGDFFTETQKREYGLRQAVKDKNIKIKQLVRTNWHKGTAKRKFIGLVKRHGPPDIVWCASDLICLGVLEASKTLALTPNQSFSLGGFDWLPETIEQINKGRVTASVGGQVFQGARAIVALYNHHQGHSIFTKNQGVYQYQLDVITQHNIDKYRPLIQKRNWEKIDFSLFTYKNKKEPLKFTIKNILKLLVESK